MITIEEMLNVVTYFAVIYLLFNALVDLKSSTEVFSNRVNAWEKSTTLELTINEEINTYFIKASKGKIVGSFVRSKNRIHPTNEKNVVVPILPIEGDCEPY